MTAIYKRRDENPNLTDRISPLRPEVRDGPWSSHIPEEAWSESPPDLLSRSSQLDDDNNPIPGRWHMARLIWSKINDGSGVYTYREDGRYHSRASLMSEGERGWRMFAVADKLWSSEPSKSDLLMYGNTKETEFFEKMIILHIHTNKFPWMWHSQLGDWYSRKDLVGLGEKGCLFHPVPDGILYP